MFQSGSHRIKLVSAFRRLKLCESYICVLRRTLVTVKKYIGINFRSEVLRDKVVSAAHQPSEGSKPSEGYYLSLSNKNHLICLAITTTHNPQEIYPRSNYLATLTCPIPIQPVRTRFLAAFQKCCNLLSSHIVN